MSAIGRTHPDHSEDGFAGRSRRSTRDTEMSTLRLPQPLGGGGSILRSPHLGENGGMEAEEPFRSRRRAPWFWQRGYSALELFIIVVGGLLLIGGLILQFPVGDDALGYTLAFIGLAMLGVMVVRDWLIGRREEAANSRPHRRSRHP
jgi:hypothetical protein